MSSTHVAEPGWRAVTARNRVTKGEAEPTAPRRLAVVVPMPRRPSAAPAPASAARAGLPGAERRVAPAGGAARLVATRTGVERPVAPGTGATRPVAARAGTSRVAVRPPAHAATPAGPHSAAGSAGSAERRPAVAGAAVSAGRSSAAGAAVSAGRRSAAGAAVSAGRRPAPLRLTRRGRVVLAAFTMLAALVVVVLLTAGSAGGAPVSSHQSAGAGYRGMTRIVVRPGQTLWSIAAAADPSADPRIVIQQIISANALGGPSIQAGQLLWVPKSS